MNLSGSELDLGLLLAVFSPPPAPPVLSAPGPAAAARSTSAPHQREDLNIWCVTGWHHRRGGSGAARESAPGLFVREPQRSRMKVAAR